MTFSWRPLRAEGNLRPLMSPRPVDFPLCRHPHSLLIHSKVHLMTSLRRSKSGRRKSETSVSVGRLPMISLLDPLSTRFTLLLDLLFLLEVELSLFSVRT